jgi:sigma-E factor negative regulatory protein RseA
MEQMQTQELISALADGRLEGEAFARGVELAAADPSGRECWATYHLIGDVLRSGELAVAGEPVAFVARLRERLQDETPVAAIPARQEPPPVVALPLEAANDTSFRWKVVAGFASFAAVSAIGWGLAGGIAARPDGVELARTANGTVLTSTADRGVMIRDPQLDELLAEHRHVRGPSALQLSTGFVRNATFESPGR